MGRLLIDYGASRCRYVVETAAGEYSDEFDSGQRDLELFIRAQLKKYEIEAVHIAYAGQVIGGDIYSAPNILADHRGLKSAIESEFGIKVKIENDLKCAALAEYHTREKGSSLAVVYIGTGFGGAMIEEGLLVRGASNLAGEIGHIPFKKAPFVCGCGKDNCVELYCSGSALSRWSEYYSIECAPTLDALTQDSDVRSASIVNDFYKALLHALGTVVTLFNPAYLIIGGSVVTNNPGLKHYIEENLGDFVFPPAAKEVKIETTKLSDGCLEGTKWL